MGNQKVIKTPSGKGTGLFMVGASIGFLSPGIFAYIIQYVVSEGIASGYLADKLKATISGEFTGGDAVSAIISAGTIFVVFLFIDKITTLLKTVGTGFAVGLTLRVIVAISGFNIPMMDASYTVPENMTQVS